MRIRPTAILIALALLAAMPVNAQTLEALGSNSFTGLRGFVIPPTPRGDAGKLIDAGLIDTEGFSFLILNMAGETKGPGAGEVGAILVPNVAPFDIAFQQLGLVPVSIEISTRLPAAGPAYFMAKQMKVEAGFPQYRVYFYNTSQATVQVAFFIRKTVN